VVELYLSMTFYFKNVQTKNVWDMQKYFRNIIGKKQTYLIFLPYISEKSCNAFKLLILFHNKKNKSTKTLCELIFFFRQDIGLDFHQMEHYYRNIIFSSVMVKTSMEHSYLH
jgi:hypothetical protein